MIVTPGYGITSAEYIDDLVASTTEAQLQALVIKHATALGFLVYHTHDSRRSEPGYPDLHLVHPTRGISMFRELKTQKGRTRPDQTKWIAALTATGTNVGIWRPRDWFDRTIENQLTAHPK